VIPLLVGPDEIDQLAKLRECATAHPIDMIGFTERLATAKGKAAHKRQMTKQTISLPVAYAVMFTIENGHPRGTIRHLSMALCAPEKGTAAVPNPDAVWTVAEQLGFVGGLNACTLWLADLEGLGKTINIARPLIATTAGSA
jgi:hypothetical protein